ncbi:hypothetical protein PVK06_005373 [Gossypium arboreum]|uniref:Uncharacterized protein n=1 Tax=Gossypium arboreum TaxID=29729 RepID=A0ABR0QUF4_GOSAR|nr:hypothetical protein PVK06_005373 [Gossypium arboreum]
MFGSMEYPITGVFYSGLKQRFLGISIPFPHHRLANRCLKNPILPLPKLHLKNTLNRQPFHVPLDSGIPPPHPSDYNPHAFPIADLHLIGDASRGLVRNKRTESSPGICLGMA